MSHPNPTTRLGSKRAIKRVIQDEVSARTGRSMSNKAAKKWLKREAHRVNEVRVGFAWPQVREFPRYFGGMASWIRFPSLTLSKGGPDMGRTVPFGWVASPVTGPTVERLIMPAWFYGCLFVKEFTVSFLSRATARVGMFLLGYRRRK